MNQYLILDTARCNSYTIHVFKNSFETNISLFHQTKDENLDDVAPYLFKTDDTTIKKTVADHPNINFNHYLLINSSGTLTDLFHHFQRFIYKVKDGKEYFFRFYDPFVLKRFLYEYDESGLRSFFGPVTSFVIKDEDPELLIELSLKNGQLRTQRKSAEEPNEVTLKQ